MQLAGEDVPAPPEFERPILPADWAGVFGTLPSGSTTAPFLIRPASEVGGPGVSETTSVGGTWAEIRIRARGDKP